MLPFFCFRCFHVSNSAAGFRCLRCDGDRSETVMAANSYSAKPECGHASAAYYVTVEDASTQVSEEDLEPVEPTREASTQVSEEDLEPVEPTREASTQTSDDDYPSKIDGSHVYENCIEREIPSDNLDQLTNDNRNRLQVNSNANEGEFYDGSSNTCNASNLLENINNKPAVSKQTYVCEQSSDGEGENESSSDKFLRRQGPKEPIERGIKSDSFGFTDSITLSSKYSTENLSSDSSDKVKDRQDKDNISSPFSFCPQGNTSMNKCFQENSMTAISVAQQTLQTSNKFSKGRCKSCGRWFMKKWTFLAHLPNYCNWWKPYKCEECGRIFSDIARMLLHQRVHSGMKPFKCTQCDYATKWPYVLKVHLKKRHNIPPSA